MVIIDHYIPYISKFLGLLLYRTVDHCRSTSENRINEGKWQSFLLLCEATLSKQPSFSFSVADKDHQERQWDMNWSKRTQRALKTEK